jgi:hypothetical protein
MKRRVPFLLSAVLLVAFMFVSFADAPNEIEAKDVPATSGTDAGLKAYIDPVTKEFVDVPMQLDPHLTFAEDELNMSDEGLIIEKSPVSGEMVHLQGRFRHRYTAGIGDDGTHTAGCHLHGSNEKVDSNSEEE